MDFHLYGLLKHTDILNRLIVDHKLAFVDSAASERKQQDNARHLAKYVFPRQYGLASAFDSIDAKAVSSSPLVDFKMREGEIKASHSLMSCDICSSYHPVQRFHEDTPQSQTRRPPPRETGMET